LWQCSSSTIASYGVRKASDHKAVKLVFETRITRRRRQRIVGDSLVTKPIPQWLLDHPPFHDEWKDILQDWAGARKRGVAGLLEFVQITQACAKEWLEGRILEATEPEHCFDLCMSVQMHLSRNLHVSLSRVNRWFNIYPKLYRFINFDIDIIDSSVRLSSQAGWLEHLHELAQDILDRRVSETVGDDRTCDQVSEGASLQASRPYSSMHNDLKAHLPIHRYRIISMWDEDSQQMMTDSRDIGECIRKAGVARSGAERDQR